MNLGTPTVIIADDHEIVRAGLKSSIEPPGVVADEGCKVLAETANGFETLAAVKRYKPDLLFLDITMPLSTGSEILTDLRRWSPQTKIIIFSSVSHANTLAQLIQIGVDGMFSKNGSTELLYSKLPLILKGGKFISPECAEIIKTASDNDVSLTKRESQTLQMLMKGKSTKDIAHLQGISPRTAEKHRASLMHKLDAHSMSELISKVISLNLLDTTHP